jgi:hypothetical protein
MARLPARLLLTCLIVLPMGGCANFEERDAFHDKRIDLNRKLKACGSDSACIQRTTARSEKASESRQPTKE